MQDNGEKVQRTCADCKQLSPPVQTGYTLISPAHGWRLSKTEHCGVRMMQWRCPDCFRAFQARSTRKRQSF